jgi:hypothetical protein
MWRMRRCEYHYNAPVTGVDVHYSVRVVDIEKITLAAAMTEKA